MKKSRSKELERKCRDGEYIVLEGERSREMFVIRSGAVRITKQVAGEEVELAVLGKGEFFGEMSVLESLPRDASAVAVGTTELLVISAGSLLIRMRRDPTFAFELLRRLSVRVRTLNGRLVKALAALAVTEDRACMLYSAPEDLLPEAEPGSSGGTADKPAELAP